MADLDLDELRRVAEAATPGDWSVAPNDYDYADPVIETDVAHNPGEANGYGVDMESRYVAQTSYDGLSHTTYNSHADAAYIAAMDPPTTLALLAEVVALREQVARVRTLHVREGGAEGWMGTHADWLETDVICGWCTYDNRTVPWPCPTIAALDAAPKEPRP